MDDPEVVAVALAEDSAEQRAAAYSAVHAAVRDAEANGEPVESAFSRKRSFRKKTKKYGPSRKGVADLSLRRARDQRS